ncbi:uncharacterized protein LOC129754148 [Uranotaenia lowii]|uniref:uncharacterized protein LOC129754148 n=1 Tax=Uranotaenia lowii TaxID=190385 RepID=UPI00247A5A69|nr:uncharacterized protein LOC129754148 [Uranotaenia lowii]XP_055606020.1 uncharacterized protein LOC129754148 [Uranotaenia lowii]XP_055606027.1 uncharacterized protein LOC129754148 [Uranotaenia lowii]
MAAIAPSIYAAIVTCLGFACFALSATAVGLPVWANFRARDGYDDQGYFGPWKLCRRLTYNYREKCGSEVSHLRPSHAVFVSGLLAMFGCIAFGIYCVLCILQIAMISSREKVLMRYTSLVFLKLFFAVVGTVLALIAAIVFGVSADNSRGQFEVTRGVSFYVQLIVVGLAIVLTILAVLDVLLARQKDGDPTMLPTISSASSGRSTPITVVNPGYRDTPRGRGIRVGISVTDSSGRPHTGSSATVSGSVQSMNTTLTSMSGASSGISTNRTPLRSSLKKPRPPGSADTLGIQNPGFSGSNQSPRLSRNGSVKKVRIQTHDTEV